MRTGTMALYIVLILVLIALNATSCIVFLAEGQAPPQAYWNGEQAPKDALVLDAEVVEVNPARELIRLFVVPRFQGTLAAASPRLPSKDLDVTIGSASGPKELKFRRDHHAEPFELDVAMSEGDIFVYPMDRYKAWLEAEAFGSDGAPVATIVNLKSNNHAMHVTSRLSSRTEKADLVVRLDAARRLPIVTYTWFMVAIMVVMALAVMLVVIAVLTGRREVNFGMPGWAAALLFALPAVRNSLPGAPPLGALIDYAAFFWAESLVGISLLVLLLTWFKGEDEPAN